MKITEQGHEILHMDGIERIEIAGRTCYKSEDHITTDQDCDCEGFDVLGPGIVTGSRDCPKCLGTGRQEGSAPRFARMLIKRGHEAMIEHASATVKFITNRGVTHELVRHRLCAFGQESTRYVNYGGDDIAFIRPVWFADRFDDYISPKTITNAADKTTKAFLSACHHAERQYNKLLSLGWQPQQAREVLPNSLKTEIVVTANFREWRHIFKLRAIGTTGRPHPQMQALMLPVLEEFAERCPAVFGNLVEHKEQ